MEGDLYQRNLGNGIDPDEEGSPDGSGRGMIVDDQIDGELRPYLQPLELQREERVQEPLLELMRERMLEWVWERQGEERERERERERQEEEEERELLQTLLPRLSLPQRRLLPRLVRLFNQGPTSAAVNGGELMNGGIQLYDGGVGCVDGIGNGFGANDQEQPSASINGEQPPWLSLSQLPRFVNPAVNGGELVTRGIQLYDGRVGRGDGIGNGFGASSSSISGESSTSYVRASDYVRHVSRENGEVHFHMNSFGNVDARVYNLTQAPHLNNRRSSQQINKVMLTISGPVGVALMVAALNVPSLPPAFYFVVAASTVGYIATLTSMVLRNRKPWASEVLAKVGAIATSAVILLSLGMAIGRFWAYLFFLFLWIIVSVVVVVGKV